MNTGSESNKTDKLVISPAQALLILINQHYDDPEKAKELKKLYLNGVTSDSDKDRFKHYLQDEILQDYQVESLNREIINEDPTRRYFETHLAYESLPQQLDAIETDKLKHYADGLMNKLTGFSIEGDDFTAQMKRIAHNEKIKETERILNNTVVDNDENRLKEFANLIYKIESGEIFQNCSQKQRTKLLLIAKSAFLGVQVASSSAGKNLPIDIYESTEIYSARSKGKQSKKHQGTTRNQNLGLLKGHMAIPRDDIALGNTETPLLKPSDQAGFKEFDPGAEWVNLNFDRLVHPYSNAISGTMLCTLRNLAQFSREDNTDITESKKSFEQFARVYISSLLYASGGHSLLEFTYPFQVQEIRDEFSHIPDLNDINLESLFLNGNEEAFEKALNDTITYNQMMLARANLSHSIRSVKQSDFQEKIQPIIEQLNEVKSKYDTTDRKLFKRQSPKKATIINHLFQQIVFELKNSNFDKAQQITEDLSNSLEQNFTRTNFGGKTKASVLLAQELSTIVSDLKKTQDVPVPTSSKLKKFKQQVKNVREIEKQNETQSKLNSSKFKQLKKQVKNIQKLEDERKPGLTKNS